jgi:metal-responsive CopG/Arc/MetJ family transcriptional regulator
MTEIKLNKTGGFHMRRTNTTDKKLVGFYIDVNLKKAIDEFIGQWGINRSELCEQALREYINTYNIKKHVKLYGIFGA